MSSCLKPSDGLYDSLFTPPPSPLSPISENTPIIFCRTRLSHVMVPPLSRPKSDYIRMSNRVQLAKRPHSSLWKNTELLDLSDSDEGQPRKKKRKRKHEDQYPRGYPSKHVHDDDESVIFVNMNSSVKRRVKEKPDPAENYIIDLTLDDEEVKPSNILSAVPHHIKSVLSPARQPASDETRLRIGVVYSISPRTLLANTRFLRGTTEDIVHTTDPQKDVVRLDSFPQKRRALLEINSEGPRSPNDEFSLGYPVVTVFGPKPIHEDYDHYYEDETIEILDSSSESPLTQVPEATAKEMPKIDLAAKYRKKKKQSIAPRRTSSVLTPSGRKVTTPAQPTSSTVSRSPVSSLRNSGLVEDVAMHHEDYTPYTPRVPSAKALGKRKALDSPLQPMQLRPDIQSFSSPSHHFVTTSGNLPAYANTDNHFDLFSNYSSTALTPDNPLYGYLDSYPNPTLSASDFVDHHHHPPSPSFPSVEPTQPLLYHPVEYPATANDFNPLPAADPPQSEPTATMFRTWSPELESGFQYDGGTVNPSLLGGETVDAENEILDLEKEGESLDMDKSSPLRWASPSTLSSTSKYSSMSRLHHSRKEPASLVNNAPNHSRRRQVKRPMPDTVPFVSFSPESEDASSVIATGPRVVRSISPHDFQPRTKSRPTVARKVSAPLPAALKMTGPKVKVGKQLWPMQDEAAYCHQCRSKTMVLKIKCRSCPRAYCVRCLTERYPDEPKALQIKKIGCPDCLGFCNCTACCKKRGVQYISTKDAMADASARIQLSAPLAAPMDQVAAPRNQLAAPRKSRLPAAPRKSKSKLPSPSVVSSSFSSPAPDSLRPPSRPSSPSLCTLLAPPPGAVYWGTIYGADGSKIGVGYRCAKEDLNPGGGPAVSSMVVPEADPADVRPRKKKRVYVGKIHPSWHFDDDAVTSVLDPVPRPKMVHKWRTPRTYVGKKALLFYKTEGMANELADLSPLSCLEEDWKEDEEDEEMMEVMEVMEEGGRIGVVDDVVQDSYQTLRDASTLSGESLTDHDIMRAIGLGLNACGIQLAG